MNDKENTVVKYKELFLVSTNEIETQWLCAACLTDFVDIEGTAIISGTAYAVDHFHCDGHDVRS